jgi:hypothetical protein
MAVGKRRFAFSKNKINVKTGQEPYWHYLIRHYMRKGFISNGLTIPYIIGARTIVEPQEPLLNVRSVVHSMVNYGATLMRCPMIGEIIVGSIDYESNPDAADYRRIGKLIITDQSLAVQDSREKVDQELETLYQPIADAGTYSKEDGEWKNFSTAELQRLREVGYPHVV